MKNPIINGYYADPDAAFFGGRLYVYPTTDGVGWEEAASFRAFSSEDLVNFKDEGVVLDFKDVPWTEGVRAWAPAICEKDGKYYFYFTGNFQIGVAVADSPVGPFVDKGEPIVYKGEYEFGTIDPDVFIDDDGQAYLYWGNRELYVSKLSDNMLDLASKPLDITPQKFNEGVCVFKRKGIYYFTWSCGDTRSPDYHVRYGKGTSPMQIPEGSTPILHRDFADDKRIRCTGHHTVVNVPGTDDWYILYHRFDAEKYGDVEGFSDEAGAHRQVCIDKLAFDDEGNILPVKPTND